MRLFVATPDLIKFENEPIYRAGPRNREARFHALFAPRGVYMNLLRLRIDQPAYFDAVRDPCFHLRGNLAEPVAF
jgi:hypothetical protein